jgi:hypothetical protein
MVAWAKGRGMFQGERFEQGLRRYEETKKKIDVSKYTKSKLENFWKAKLNVANRDVNQWRINLRNCQLEIKNVRSSIEHTRSESVRAIERAKANSKLPDNLVADLNLILKSL